MSANGFRLARVGGVGPVLRPYAESQWSLCSFALPEGTAQCAFGTATHGPTSVIGECGMGCPIALPHSAAAVPHRRPRGGGLQREAEIQR